MLYLFIRLAFLMNYIFFLPKDNLVVQRIMNPRNLAIMLGLISVLNAKMMIVIVTMTRRRMRKEMMNLMMEMDQNKVTKAMLVEDPEENQQRLNGSIPFGAETLSKRTRTNKMILTTELSMGFVS